MVKVVTANGSWIVIYKDKDGVDKFVKFKLEKNANDFALAIDEYCGRDDPHGYDDDFDDIL